MFKISSLTSLISISPYILKDVLVASNSLWTLAIVLRFVVCYFLTSSRANPFSISYGCLLSEKSSSRTRCYGSANVIKGRVFLLSIASTSSSGDILARSITGSFVLAKSFFCGAYTFSLRGGSFARPEVTYLLSGLGCYYFICNIYLYYK